MNNQAICQATTKRGVRCTCAPIRGEKFCYWHSPRTKRKKEQEEFLQTAREGLDLSTIEGANRLLALVIKGVLAKKIDARTAQSIGYNTNILTRNILNIELEKRIAELEERLESELRR